MAQLDPRIEKLFRALCEVPEMATLLGNRVTRTRVYRALAQDEGLWLALTSDHDLDHCIARASAYITVRPPTGMGAATRSRRAYTPTSDVIPAVFSADSQEGQMLRAFYDAGEDGLTDDVAAERAGLGFGAASSPWRRATTLRELGMITVMEDDNGDAVHRVGLRGTERMVSVITEDGRAYWEELA